MNGNVDGRRMQAESGVVKKGLDLELLEEIYWTEVKLFKVSLHGIHGSGYNPIVTVIKLSLEKAVIFTLQWFF